MMAQLTGTDYSTFVSRAAEVATARGAYSTLNARLDAFTLAGGNVATLTNGAASAGQKNVTVDNANGFIVSGRVAYALAGGTLEYNAIASIGGPTTITLTTNIGTGGIANNTLFTMISESEYQAAQAINHVGNLTLPQAIQYVGSNMYNVRAYGVSPSNSAATNSANLQILVDLATSTGPGVIYFPFSVSYYDFAKAGTSSGGVGYAVNVPNPAGSLWFIGHGAKLRTSGVVNGTPSTHFCLFLVEALTSGTDKGNINWRGLHMEGTNSTVAATLTPYSNRGIFLYGNYIAHCSIEDCAFHYFYSAGVGLFGNGLGNAIRNCRAWENGENGINWNCGPAGQIIGNRCWGNVSGGIEASSAKTIVQDNHCWENSRGIAIGGYTSAADGRGNMVSGNICHDNTESGLYITTGMEYGIFSDNILFRNGDYGMVVYEDLSYIGVYTRYNLIKDNYIYGNEIGGIYVKAVGNMFYQNIIIPGDEGGSFPQVIGVNLENTDCDETHLVGNHCFGHGAADYIINEQNNLIIDTQPGAATISIDNDSDITSEPNRGLAALVASGSTYTTPPTAKLLWVFSSPTTITLPAAAKYPPLTPLIIKDKQGTAGANTITISTAGGGDVIEGSGGSITITNNYGYRILVSDGSTSWYIIGSG